MFRGIAMAPNIRFPRITGETGPPHSSRATRQAVWTAPWM